MKIWIRKLVAAMLVWLVLLGAVMYGEFIEVPPVRPQEGEGILAQLQARLPDGLPKESSNASIGHYGGHYINSRVRNTMSPYGGFLKGNAGYIYGGWAFVCPNFPVTITEAQALARTTMPGWSADMRREWDESSGYIVDELAAYLCGAAAAIENGWDNNHVLRGDIERAIACYRVLHAAAYLSKQRGYPADRQTDLELFLGFVRTYIDHLETLQ